MDDDSPDDSKGGSGDDSRPTTSIPKYERGDEVVAWTEVDSEWWEHVQHAREVHEEVVATYGGEPGVEYIERGTGEETIGGLATNTITILVADGETAEALDVPDEMDGIPLVVEVGQISDAQ